MSWWLVGEFAMLLTATGLITRYVIQAFDRDYTARTSLARLFGLTIVVLGIGFGGSAFFRQSPYPVMFAIVATGVIAFYGLLLHVMRNARNARLEDRDIRSAVAAALSAMYIVLVGASVFIGDREGQPINPFSEYLITSFSFVVAVVIASYFGSSAYVEVQKLKQRGTKAQT